MLPNESSWDAFYKRFQSMSKIDLWQYKQDQLRRRTLSMAEAKGHKTLEEFSAYVCSSAVNVQWFVDKLAINVSELFRNPEKWKEMEDKIVPLLLQQASSLKCWSAGCSYGAEAHTLATILAAKYPGRHQVIGTDIDQAALNQAKSGQFNDADMRCVPANYKSQFFKQNGDIWQASDAIRKYCTFRTGDLLKEPQDSGFDLIMCRNVVIYFTEPAKDELYARFFRALKPGGILFVGGTERIFKSKEIGFETPVPFFYQKPKHGEKVWRNAS